MLTSFIGCGVALILETALVASYASPIGLTPNQAGLRASVAAL